MQACPVRHEAVPAGVRKSRGKIGFVFGKSSVQHCFVHAREAMAESSDLAISAILPAAYEEQPGLDLEPRTQRQRCHEVFERQHTELAKKLDPNGLVLFMDNHSKLSSQWLYAIPRDTVT
jgi:hypothetical protein